MITKRTVLVLGAGASIPFGFPSGPALREKVLHNVRNPDTAEYQQLKELGHAPPEIDAFAKALFESPTDSVDVFLEHRTEFLQIGKRAIAQALIPYEVGDRVLQGTALVDNWYKYLFDKLRTPSAEELLSNQLKILTYNYDRSLEHFLCLSMCSLYRAIPEAAAILLSEIEIVHLHGRLCCLPWQQGQRRPYTNETGISEVQHSADSIKIIHENVETDPEFQTAHKLLNWAERIYFLGFGYNQTNVERLRLGELSQDQMVQGTSLSFNDRERKKLNELLTKRIGLPRISLYSTKILDFFRNYADLD